MPLSRCTVRQEEFLAQSKHCNMTTTGEFPLFPSSFRSTHLVLQRPHALCPSRLLSRRLWEGRRLGSLRRRRTVEGPEQLFEAAQLSLRRGRLRLSGLHNFDDCGGSIGVKEVSRAKESLCIACTHSSFAVPRLATSLQRTTPHHPNPTQNEGWLC